MAQCSAALSLIAPDVTVCALRVCCAVAHCVGGFCAFGRLVEPSEAREQHYVRHASNVEPGPQKAQCRGLENDTV